eukprot:CAMPEP_0170464500 /NCGR_PEP_ID=MMETSP0123-20130129/9204_1 /TAXON_ID=182087 /ORGANISM="Favella ehrenbergii, Strain Fehren 1" /LENGTH=247 /DNA_ID=CAMNT_0010730179 /DNA_START=573 /DNA_END=1314 /DNA_ORIENTATION=-
MGRQVVLQTSLEVFIAIFRQKQKVCTSVAIAAVGTKGGQEGLTEQLPCCACGPGPDSLQCSAAEAGDALNFVQINDEALVVTVQGLDALAAKDVEVVRAVEVLDALGVLLAELLGEALLVFVLEVKAGAREDRVLLDDLVEDVDVERQTLCTLELLDELAADGAPHAVLMVQLLNAVRAEGVAAVDQDARDALAHVVLESAELTDVQPARLIIQIHQVDAHCLLLRVRSGRGRKLKMIDCEYYPKKL